MSAQDDILAKYGVSAQPPPPAANDILAKYGVSSSAPSTPPKKSSALDTAVDVGKSLVTGLAKAPGGFDSVTPEGIIRNLGWWASHGLAGAVAPFSPEAGNAITGAYDAAKTHLPVPSEATQNIANSFFGGYHKPQTFLGRLAETGGEMAPAAFGGEGAAAPTVGRIAANVARRVAAPALGATSLGSLIPEDRSPTGHAVLSTIGALGGGLLSGGAQAGINALQNKSLTPADSAVRYIQNLMNAEGSTVGSVERAGAQNAGRGITAAEAIGPSGVTGAGALARRSGETGATLKNTLTDRNMSSPNRLMDDYAQASGIHPEAARGNIDALVEAGQKAVSPLYTKAYQEGANGVMTPALQALANRPVIRKAMQLAADDIRNGGGDPNKSGLFIDKDGLLKPVTKPTLEAWDMAKKRMGDLIEKNVFGKRLPDSESRGNYNINLATGQLSGALGDAVPTYKQAVAQSGDYLSIRSAFERGQNVIFNNKTTPDQVTEALAGMNPAERQSFLGGIANKLFDMADSGKLKANASLLVPRVQQKLVAALGADKAKVFLDGIQKELALGQSGSRMMTGVNSPTFEFANAAAEQDNPHLEAGIHGAKALWQLSGHNVPGALWSAYRAVGPYLKTQGMTPEARNVAGRLLTGSPEELANYWRQPRPVPPAQPSAAAPLLSSFFAGH